MSRAGPPLVSVVIPYFNHGRHLHQAVHSCLRAYAGPLEILIVNDGSTEAKAAYYLEAAAALSPTVQILHQENQGLSAARNAGIAAASGAFVQLLDSDDFLAPGKLDLQVRHFGVQPDLSVSVTNYLLADAEGHTFWRDGDPISRFDFSRDDFLLHWERGFSIPIHAALFRRGALGEAPFDTSLAGKEDWLFWSRLALAGHEMAYVPVFGAVYRQHASSMSKSFAAMGEAWLAAARLIERRMPADEAPAFRVASQAWHDHFYKPRAAQQAGSKPPARALVTEATRTAVFVAAESPGLQGDDAPLISVIVPVYNHYRYLHECLSSLLTQTVAAPFEIVVIDDASSDARVWPLLQAFAAASPRITVLRNEANLGIAATQDKAVDAARGVFLAFLDCDDALEPDALATVSEALDGADYLFTDRTDIDESGRRLRTAVYGGYDHIASSGDIAADLLDGMIASHLKVIRRKSFLAVGGFDPMSGGVQDWELALKMAQAGARMRYLPRAVYRHRIHTGSVTGADSVRQFWLTNVIRRRFIAGLRPGVSDEAAREAAMRRDGADVLVVRESVDSKRLRAAWSEGKICVFEGDVMASLGMLREFNAYFDAVHAPDEAGACALVGYMWDHRALRLAGEV